MSPKSAIEHAEYIVGIEEQPSQLVLDLAWEKHEEAIFPYLNELADNYNEQDDDVKEKFLYLMLNWVFEHKEQFSDTLEVVEIIYADFDYPKEISSFVRYMPAQEPLHDSVEENTKKLYENWASYLNEKKRSR